MIYNLIMDTQASSSPLQQNPFSQTQGLPLTQAPPPEYTQVNKQSALPIIISVVGGVLYLALLIMNSLVLLRVIKFLNVTGPIGQQTLPMAILPVVALFLIVFANFGFAFYLLSKRKKGENVNNALILSLSISVPAILVQLGGYLLAMNINRFI